MIADLIKKARVAAGLNHWELAIKCGEHGRKITGVSIYNYEREYSSPTVETLEAIAKATGTRLIIAFHKNP